MFTPAMLRIRGIIAHVLILFKIVAGECPNGFVHHDDMCYHFSHDTETWADALVICNTVYGSQLVEIEDSRENAYLVNYSKSTRYWTGGNDLAVEGEFQWATSKVPVTFKAFNGAPSNSGGNENCIELSEGSWNDNECDRSQNYICERPVNSEVIVG